jgi:putative heme transporter
VIESEPARRPVWPGMAVTAGIAVIAAAVIAGAAAAERSRLAGSVTVLARLHVTWVLVGILLEAVSMAAFAAMFRRLLSAGRVRPARTSMLTTIYAANAMSVTVPLAGPGLAAAYLFRRFTRFGAGALLSGWALLAGGVISAVTWALVLVGGGLASGHMVALAITVPCLTLAVIVTVMIVAAARRPRLRAALERYLTQALKLGSRLLRWPATNPKLAVRAWAERLGALRLRPSGWALATGDGLVNWLADAGVLAVSILAVGTAVPWRDLLLVYAAGIGAQSLSLTPGGLGITEGAISVALVASGLRVGQAVAAAVLYRLISFWLVAAVGWLILLFLRIRRPAAESAPEPALEPAPWPVNPPATQPSAHELVLLHGQPGTAADWQGVLARLPPHLHAVATDRPGYGASQHQAAGFKVNAQAVLQDLEERNVDSAVLVASKRRAWRRNA